MIASGGLYQPDPQPPTIAPRRYPLLQLTINALTAANELLIPMSMEYLALRGLDMLAKTVTKVRAVTNPDLTYLGILATKYDRRTLNSQEIFEALQRASHQAGIHVFNTFITNLVLDH